jgi:hypothetical protein
VRWSHRCHSSARSSGSPTGASCCPPVARLAADAWRTSSTGSSASPRCSATPTSNSSCCSPTKTSSASIDTGGRSGGTAGSWPAAGWSRSSSASASPAPTMPPGCSRPACPSSSTPPSSPRQPRSSARLAQQVTYCLRALGVLHATGKRGNAIVHRRTDTT